MSFMETPRFPERISVGAAGGPGYSTDIASTRAGFESRNINWQQARARYDLAHEPRTEAEKETLLAFFRMAHGAAIGFRFRDWSDYRCAAAAGLLQGRLGSLAVGLMGFGHGVPVYRLFKRYGSGSFAEDRDIRKPVAGTVTVQRAGLTVTFGAGAGQIALDATLGAVTFVADQTRTISSHTVGAAHQVTLSSAFAPNVIVGSRVWLDGITGTAAAALNNLSHAVTAVSTNVVTLATATTGLTASGGVARLFPQPSESLAWAGEFDVPVRFESDDASLSIVGRNEAGALYSWQTNLVEIRIEP